MYPPSAAGLSELAAVEAWVAKEGLEQTRERFERHWREYVSDADLDWLRDVARCNCVRLPVGFFTLGEKFCEGTAFKGVKGVYRGAWEAVRRLVGRLRERGVGVVIDLHGLPGGANTDIHSGTDSGKAELFSSKRNMQLARECVCFVVEQARTMEGIAGVQIVNEADWDLKGMYPWYEKVLADVSRIDPTIPIYVSDGWNLSRAISWSQTMNSPHTHTPCNPVVIDTHLYWAFTDEDKAKTPQQITHEASGKLSELDGHDGSVIDHGAAQVIVGEWSCVLTEDSWAKRHDVPKDDLVRDFGRAQAQRYQHRAGGAFFWTYRMDWMPGGEWGFRQMTESQAVAAPGSLTLSATEVQERLASAQGQRDYRRGTTWGAHCQYWDSQYPGYYEHYRFEQGWEVGFGDAAAFFGMRVRRGLEGGDRIGMLDLWCLKRLRESGQVGASFAWEWEQGFRQGVRDFYEVVGA